MDTDTPPPEVTDAARLWALAQSQIEEDDHLGWVIVMIDTTGFAVSVGPFDSPRDATSEATRLREEGEAEGFAYREVLVIPLLPRDMKESSHG